MRACASCSGTNCAPPPGASSLSRSPRQPNTCKEGTIACAADSKKFGAWDGNPRTEWSARHRGPGVLIYWHPERKAACFHSQSMTVSSSQVAAIIESVLHHCTAIEVDRISTDFYGQSEAESSTIMLLETVREAAGSALPPSSFASA